MLPRDLPPDWPNRLTGRVVPAAGHRWWVVEAGPQDAPALLLLHGLAASGHSFRTLLPGLAARYRVILPDLPGQGCSRAGTRARMGLELMAQDLLTLCDALGVTPRVVIGHSAGAALALQIARMRPLAGVVGLNAALGNYGGLAAGLFAALARGLASLPFVAPAMARLWASPDRVQRLLQQTGSDLDAAGRGHYLTLLRDPDHLDGALGMMAAWRLDGLLQALPEITTPTLLLAGQGDLAVPAAVSRQAAARMRAAECRILPGGHLMHEESPDGLAGVILDWLQGLPALKP